MDAHQDIQAIEDWDNYQGADIYDYRPLTAPSTDIKEDMEAALSEAPQPESTSAFAHSNVYTDAPNPCLNLDGVGSIGLPLSERDALAIASVSVVGWGVEQGLWTLPGDKVHFDNPQWTDWVSAVASSVNTALAVDVPMSLIRCRLRSLTLRTAYAQMRYGSRQYGILSVILPSRHIGGQIRITHQVATEAFNIAWNTAASTTVVGAYTGVTQSFDPIQSGYVVCLCYELDYLGPSLSMPQLPQPGGTATRLHHVFRSWRQRLYEVQEHDDDDDVPPFVAYLLDHTYSDVPHFNASALQGSDRLMLKQIAPFAKAYGFNLHLAQVTYTEMGGVTLDIDPFDFASFVGSRRFGYGYEFGGYGHFEDIYDADDVEMDEVEQRELAFRSVSTLDGMPMQMTGKAIESLHNDFEYGGDGFINGDMIDGEKESDFERYNRSVRFLYKRSALVISPKESEVVKFAVGDISAFAYAQLKSSVSMTPSTRETLFISTLLRWLKDNRSSQTSGSAPPVGITAVQVANVLRESADRWNNVNLFLQVLQNCGADHCVSLVGVDGLLSAYQTFDWNKLKDFYGEGLSKTTSSSLRGQVVGRLLLTATEQNNSEVVAWCLAQQARVLDTMQTLEAADIEWVLNFAQTESNPTHYLQTVLIPRLHTVQPYEMTVWTALLTRLDEIVRSGLPSWDVRLLPQIVKKCLEDIVSVMPPYAVAKTPQPSDPPGGTATTTIKVLSVEPIMTLFELGSRLGLVEVCMPVLQKMWAQRDVQKAAAGDSADLSPTSYYAALVPKMKSFLQDKPRLKRYLEPFFEQAIEVLLPSYLTHTAVFQTALQYSSNNVFEILKNILTVDHAREIFKKRSVIKEFALFMSDKLRPQARTPEAAANLTDILKWCLARLTRSFDLRSLFTHSLTYGISGNPGIELLRLCYALQFPACVDQVVERFPVLPPSPLAKAEYIKSGLLPLLKALPDLLTTHGTSLTAAPYANFAAQVMKMYIEHVLLGPKPLEVASLQDLRAVGCGCPICNVHLVPFLTADGVKKHYREKQSVRTHLEQRLARTLRWGVTWTTHRVGSPHTLEVEKPQSMVAHGLWVKNQKDGADLLKILGNAEQQRQTLGSDYESVAGALVGVAARPLSTIQVNGVNVVKRPSDATDEVGLAKKPRLS
ncbi:hypothetical protein BDZ89DRAFT_1070638 [Hymenopellis radicata]|nr:hypothetical protein BDZ89DRAFT_1070638 [Hymenopellis radicata]